MAAQTPTLEHPVRAVVIGAVVVALVIFVGSCVADVPGYHPSPLFALAVGFGYGLVLGMVSVGWVLLAVDLPAMRWWWLVLLPLPFMGKVVIAIGLANKADLFTGWFPIALNVIYQVLVSCLLAGCLLAFAGWWRYVRRLLAAVDN